MKNKLKKWTAVLLTALMLFGVATAAPVSVSAAEATQDSVGASSGATGDCTWTLNNGTLTISGNGAMRDYSYSSSLPWGTSIKSVIIENGVTSISNYAFYDCTGLTSVTIPDSVTSIGDCAFDNCTGLTSVTIPDSVTSIGEYAFEGCTGLTSITIPDSVTSIGEYAFEGCTGLTSVTIGEYAFYGCPVKVGFTGKCVWILGTDGTLIISGNGVMGDYDYEYYGGNYITTAPWGANIKTVVIKDGVTSIGDDAFRGCTGLTSVTIGNSVTSIGEIAFYGCGSLTSVTIPDSVTSIGEYAFSDCTGLTSVTVESGNSVYDSRNNCNAIIKTATNELICGCKTTVIPNSVTSIGDGAFSGCTGLTSVTIPDSVTSIGSYAFSGCTGLTSVTIPNSVTSIGMAALNNTAWYNNQPDGLVYAGKVAYEYKGTMPNNTSITIQDGTKVINDYAFSGCTGLTSVTIPDSVTSIGDDAFEGCTGLTSVTIPDSVTSIGSTAFYDTAWYNNQPDGLVYAGKVAYEYKGTMPNNTSITIQDGTKAITDYAFYGCTGLTSVTIPDSVTRIGDDAFNGCTGLTSVTIPDSVTSIGSYAFHFCTGLTSVTIPDSVTSIGGSAFYGCTGLTSVTISDSVTSIGNYAFYGCTGLTSVTIPDSVTRIGNEAFRYCKNLTIYGKEGSYAQKYANKNSIPFVAVADTAVGDANNDGALNVSDVTSMQRIIAEFEPLTPEKLAVVDANGDGKFSIEDATLLQMYLAEYDVKLG